MFNTQATPAPELPAAPHISITDGQPTTTSLQVAQHFDKRHADVMRAIRNLLQELPAERQRNFALIQIDVDLGMGRTRKDPAYRITHDGFMLLAMGFTGPQALTWKLAYLDAFNAMADQLARLALNAATAAAAPLPAPGAPQPSIDVRALMLTGQSAAKPVTAAHQALIDAQAWVMAGEVFEISRQHLARRVAYRASDAERVNPPNARITQIIKATTLGQALAHTYHAEIQQIMSVSRALLTMSTKTYVDMHAVADKLTNP